MLASLCVSCLFTLSVARPSVMKAGEMDIGPLGLSPVSFVVLLLLLFCFLSFPDRLAASLLLERPVLAPEIAIFSTIAVAEFCLGAAACFALAAARLLPIG